MAVPLIQPRSARTPLLAIAASLIVLLAGVIPAGQAYASPTAQQIESQMNALWAQLEPLINQYDAAQDQLNQNQAKQNALKQKLAPLQMQVDLSQSRVGALAAQAYERGPGSRLVELLDAGSPQDLLDEMSTLDQMARHQQSEISATQTQLDEYNREKAPLDVLVAQEQQQVNALNVQKTQIQGQLDQLQKLRLQAYGSSGTVGGSLKPVPCPEVYVGGAAGKAVAYACSKIGDPYVFGATGQNSFDCSGLTEAAWASAGFSLYHYTGTQQQETRTLKPGEAPMPGDLVFYGHPAYHVAIYIGMGYMVHAPRPGDHVREAPVNSPGPVYNYGRVTG